MAPQVPFGMEMVNDEMETWALAWKLTLPNSMSAPLPEAPTVRSATGVPPLSLARAQLAVPVAAAVPLPMAFAATLAPEGVPNAVAPNVSVTRRTCVLVAVSGVAGRLPSSTRSEPPLRSAVHAASTVLREATDTRMRVLSSRLRRRQALRRADARGRQRQVVCGRAARLVSPGTPGRAASCGGRIAPASR